jgi:hypothetical protein
MIELTLQQKIEVVNIYERIVVLPWFNRNAITEKELLILILEKIGAGVFETLSAECEAEAHRRFSR